MNEVYKNLLKSLIKAYYDDEFYSKVNEIILKEDIDKRNLFKVISNLCGVDVDFKEDYIINLEKAIISYNSEHKIVDKVRNCSKNCKNNSSKTLCEKSCPFNAIVFQEEKSSISIDKDICIHCGFCVEACKEGIIMDKIQFIPLANLLKNNETVIAAVAPAIIGQFGQQVTMNQLRTAFKKIGFKDMVEVAFFADILTLKEAIEFNHLVNCKDDFMITSCCCPMWVAMVKKVYNNLVKHVSPSVSPMIAAGRVLKKLNPNCKVVFIGPCIAKKAEAKEKDIVDAIDFVLTFEELNIIFETLNIKPIDLQEDISTEYSSKGGRLYGRVGGVSIAVSDTIKRMYKEKHRNFVPIQAHGVAHCKELLSRVQCGKDIDANFIEGMGCVGGCIGGPKTIKSAEEGRKAVDKFAEESEIKVALDSYCMKEILEKININSSYDFENKENIDIFQREF